MFKENKTFFFEEYLSNTLIAIFFMVKVFSDKCEMYAKEACSSHINPRGLGISIAVFLW